MLPIGGEHACLARHDVLGREAGENLRQVLNGVGVDPQRQLLPRQLVVAHHHGLAAVDLTQ